MLVGEYMPKISVLMGVLCRKDKLPMLKRAVDSILKQSYSNFELLICDDGSDNEIIRYLNELAYEDDRIILIRDGNLISLSEKLNACFRASSGEFIARMDDDDYSHPERFNSQMEYLRHNENVSFVGCNVRLYDNGDIVGLRVFPDFPVVKDFYIYQPFIHPTLIFRRKAFVLSGGYSEEKRCLLCEDYDLLLRMYSLGLCGANIQEALFDYTLSETAKGKKKYRFRINEAKTRFIRYKELKCLPKAIPYVIKPLLVGLIPYRLLCIIKKHSGLFNRLPKQP